MIRRIEAANADEIRLKASAAEGSGWAIRILGALANSGATVIISNDGGLSGA